jgi:hypothetical protein
VKELEGNQMKIRATNLRELRWLCNEFGFEEFSARLSKFVDFWNFSKGGPFGSVFAGVPSVFLNESIEFIVNGKVIGVELAEAAALFPTVREQLSVDGCGRKFFVNLNGMETSDIRSLELLLSGESISKGVSEGLLIGLLGNADFERLFFGCLKSDTGLNLSELMKERCLEFKSFDVSIFSIEALDSLLFHESFSIESEDALLRVILNLGSDHRDLLRHIQLEFLSEDGLSLLSEYLDIAPESVWECAAELISHPSPPRFNTQILSDLPEIFAEFRGKRFSVLWRGSRDGFSASQFHGRCDGHANTLTVIFDTKGNIFGGFTPAEWESRDDWKWKVDDSLKSFLFTLKNPHNIPARKFTLKPENKHHAIGGFAERGPSFWDVQVYDECNANTDSYTCLDCSYANDTALDNFVVFTGSKDFKVKEIEVFEITD